MIGKLKGVVDSLHEDHVILDVHGVGYIVSCSTRTLQNLPRAGEAAILAIETQVREDSIKLFGFLSDSERDWFRILQNVQGVGSKVALAILSILPPTELTSAIALQDKAAVARAPGVGPKLAARIVSELKDKAGAFGGMDAGAIALAGAEAAPAGSTAAHEAVSALINLGYARPQAATAIAASLKALGEGAETAALIRRGLKELAQ
ncbi:Holliday junction branch migration protein RuvA [Rhodoblastus acidophilus]|uniref:Holliday junction branch migration complex subunit RuvA n=1 Tax=Candidatus Rhodoblastus alkanivorans TaxID=2954117 RepID=A0ABS9Z2N2_9HYPH|nr:Holliday junction branch migration protein RuvA [Candidatus Rhodoblastus alkanivorans]MCI4677570.1 Holliday junction branch migration protein RuvA [Candidatus Rhodoblastus alkanivorans]MCI4681929.1 Holliday junction branch migration protein RuvA [Candidatus Rhodoblastus alkanivorans]MDI4642979.1 Holliday junction branch migration protein RuvA [Rhodoblastus acidophilus]